MVRRSAAADVLKALIHNGDYESALNHARKHNLDAEEVYAARWESSDFGVNAVQENLPFIRHKQWVINECLRRVSSSVEGVSALISFGLAETERLHRNGLKDLDRDEKDVLYVLGKRLRLLQHKDRLDTFLGIHMGRFSVQKYLVFRSVKLQSVAISFAEDGKTGALELLIKRHMYTLAPHMLEILDAIPETLSPHTYAQLLPEVRPPKMFLPRRGQDWAEVEDVVESISRNAADDEVGLHECTEFMVKLSKGLVWPHEAEISAWYLKRARKIDQLSGQLENSLFLLDAGMKKGISGLETLSKDIADLCRISFSNADCKEGDAELTLEVWESLDAFEKFKMMLRGVTEDNVVDRILEVAVPYAGEKTQDFLVRYLKEMSGSNLKICSAVIESACKRSFKGLLFKDEAETIVAGLECIYGSTQTDDWDLMSFILSKLLGSEDDKEQKTEDGGVSGNEKGLRRGFVNALRYRTQDTAFPRAPMGVSSNGRRKSPAIGEELEKKLKRAEEYIQAGKILFQYQAPTTIGFLVSSSEDVKGTKQMLRILLSKFSRKQPSRSDGEWAFLWRDLQFLHERVFTFLEKDYILFEFFRGLLKAGKFALAKSYVKDSGVTFLTSEKIENLVIQTSREYFYSANSLESPDIDRAKECLDLIPSSVAANAEFNIIVAVTEKLPYLGVTLLPAQFRQFKDPVEVLKMAIESHKGSRVPVEELFETAKLLGFKSSSEMAVVEEALAREAAAYGDVGLAQELCLGLARKGHGTIWDLCVALGRGPEDENLDLRCRKELLGFALRHCDEESIGELLGAWKEFDSMDDAAYSPAAFLDESELTSSEEDVEASDQLSNEPDVSDKEEVAEPRQEESDSESSSVELSSCNISKTLAQKSTEILLSNFGNGEITDEDLVSAEAAFGCFLNLAKRVTSKQQAAALKLLLKEWEPVFETEAEPPDVDDEEDGWGDGWQEFGVAELHSFWKVVCCKLVDFQGLQIALSLLDKRASSSRVLLNEEEAREFIDHTANKNVLSAAKLALLLPYETLATACLSHVEDELQRQAGAATTDSILLVLVLSSGLFQTLARFSRLLSALCKVAGELSSKSQAGLLLPEDSLGEPSSYVVIPYFIAELTKGRHYGAAASLVLQHMRVPAAFCTWNVSHFALKRYLEAQQSQQMQRKEAFDFNRLSESSLSYISESIRRLVSSFETVVTDALSTLAKDMK